MEKLKTNFKNRAKWNWNGSSSRSSIASQLESPSHQWKSFSMKSIFIFFCFSSFGYSVYWNTTSAAGQKGQLLVAGASAVVVVFSSLVSLWYLLCYCSVQSCFFFSVCVYHSLFEFWWCRCAVYAVFRLTNVKCVMATAFARLVPSITAYIMTFYFILFFSRGKRTKNGKWQKWRNELRIHIWCFHHKHWHETRNYQKKRKREKKFERKEEDTGMKVRSQQ